MKRRSVEDFQRERRERKATAQPHTTPGDEERKQVIKQRGLEALRRVKNVQVWDDWTQIGAALMVITEEALAAVGMETWDGDSKPLVKVFNNKWEDYERLASNEKPLSRQERSMLRFVMTHPEVGAWHATLPGPQQRRLNHPNAVVNAWKRTQPREPSAPRRPSPLLSPALAERDRKIEQLEARNAELLEELKAARETAPPKVTPSVESASPKKTKSPLELKAGSTGIYRAYGDGASYDFRLQEGATFTFGGGKGKDFKRWEIKKDVGMVKVPWKFVPYKEDEPKEKRKARAEANKKAQEESLQKALALAQRDYERYG
jgi:hypothetical protein